MRIVVNAVLLPQDFSKEYKIFLSGVFKSIASNHPEHHFIFLCDSEQADFFIFGNNSELYKTKSRKINSWSWKYWHDIRVPALLRKYKADLFFSPGGFCSSATKLPQCIMINDPLYLYHPSLYKKTRLRIYNGRTGKSIQRAKKVITLSTFTKKQLTDNFSVPEGKIDTIYNGVHENYEEQQAIVKEKIKLKYAAGKEFFFYIEPFFPNGNLINLLKAFSIFKKRQQSSFQLIIYRRKLNGDPSFEVQLEKYKYRADVKMVDEKGEPEPAIIMSSAYAFLYPVFTDDFCFSITTAMKMGIPVITSLSSAIRDIMAEAALYVHPEEPQDIANSMMLIYKDEKLRDELIKRGKAIARNYNMNKTAEQVWHSLQNALY